MTIRYEVAFTEMDEVLKRMKAKAIRYLGISFLGLVVCLVGYLLIDVPLGVLEFTTGGVIAAIGVVMVLAFGSGTLGLMIGSYAAASIIGARYDIDDKRISMHLRYQNKTVETLFNFYRNRAGGIIPLKSIRSLEYGEYQGMKSAYIEHTSLGFGPAHGPMLKVHIILPPKDPELCYKQLEEWVQRAKNEGHHKA